MFGMRLTVARCAGAVAAAAAACAAVPAPALAQDTKVALIHVKEAISGTAEGQKLIRELEQRYAPMRDRLEAKQGELAGMRDRYQKGANTMSDEARRTLARDIQKAEVELQREAEDAQGDFGQDQNELLNAVGSKMMAVIDKYSKDNGFQIVMDISNPQGPVLYAVNEVNITSAIIAAYDAANPADDAAATSP